MRTLLPKLVRFSSILLTVLNLILIVFFVLAAGRGLDATDEGLYLLLSSPVDYSYFSLIHYNLLFGHLHDLFGLAVDIFSLRYLRIIGTIAGSLILWNGLRQWMPLRRRGIDTLVFLLMAGWLNYTAVGSIQTPGYNALAFFGAQYFVGIYLLWWRSPKAWQAMLLGVVVFVLWITKFTVAVVLPLVSMVMFALHVYFHRSASRKVLFRKMFVHSALMIVVAAILIAVHLALGYKVSPADYIEYLRLNPDAGHSVKELIIATAKHKFQLLGAMSAGAVAAVLTQSYVQTQRRMKAALLNSAAAVLLLFLVMWTGVALSWGLFLVFGSAFLAASLLVRRKRYWNEWPVIVWLVFVPLIVAFGTNNPITLSTMVMLQFPLAAVFMLDRLTTVLTGAFLAVFVPLAVWSAVFTDPYRQAPLRNCTEAIEVPYTERTLLVTPEAAAYYGEVRTILSRVETPYVIGSARFMSEVYLSDKQYPGRILWYEANLTEDYFTQLALETDSFVFVQVNEAHAALFEPFLEPYEVKEIGRLNRRAFILQSRPSSLQKQEQEHGEGSFDMLTFYLCTKP